MQVKIFLPVILLLSHSCFAQDTLYIDLNKAVKMALENFDSSNTPSTIFSEHANKDNLTSFNLRYGELYSPVTGIEFEINQDIGNPFQHRSKEEILTDEKNIESSKTALKKKQYEIEVKSAFLQWIYLYNKLNIIDLKREYSDKYLDVGRLKSSLGETEPGDKLKTETKVSELETEYLSCLYDIEIAEISLQKLLLCNSYLKPSNTRLDLYMIQKQSDTSDYKGSYFTDIYQNKYKYSQSVLENSEKALYPSFSAGAFYQDFGPGRHYAGVAAGVKIPIQSIINKSAISNAKINVENSKQDYAKLQQTINLEIESLKLKLNKNFIETRHYQNFAIPLANNMIKNANVLYKNEQIDFEELINEVFEAFDIKSKYLDCINNYNQTALQLELYSK